MQRGATRQITIAFATSVWLSVEFWALGSWSWLYGYGGSLETIPTYLGLKETASTYALWAPFVAGGVDRLSFWGNADPFNFEPLLFMALPVWAANALHAFVQRFVAMLFTALVLQEQLGFRVRAAALGGVLHGCFSYYTVGAMLTSPAVPLVIWALHRLGQTRRFVVGAAAVGAGASFLTTFAHGVPYMVAFVFVWFAVVLRWRERRQILACLVFAAVMTLFEAHQLLALVANAPFSMRSVYAAESMNMSVAGLFYYQPEFDFFNQDKLLKALAVVGPPVILVLGATLALMRYGHNTDRALFWRMALVYAIVASKFVLVGGQRMISAWLPWVDSIYMGRFYMVPYPFLVPALTMCVVRLCPYDPRWLRRTTLGLSFVVILFMLVWPKVALWRPLMIDSWGQRHYEIAALDRLRTTDRSSFRVASVLDLQPSYAYAHGLEAADGWANLYPRYYRELWLRVLDPLFERLPRNRDIFAPESGRPQDIYIFLGSGLLTPGIGALPGEDPTRAVRDGFDIAGRFNLNLVSLLNVKYLLSLYPLRGSNLELVHAPRPLPERLVSYDYATGLVNSARETPWTGESPVQQFRRLRHEWYDALERRRRGKDVFIYRNSAVLPRFRFVQHVELFDSPEQLLDALSAAPITELADTVFIEAADAPASSALDVQRPRSTLVVESYGSGEIVLRLRASSPGLIVAAMTWNPFWIARFEGRRLPIVRANHAQMAIRTPGGNGRLVLRYEPPYAFILRPAGL